MILCLLLFSLGACEKDVEDSDYNKAYEFYQNKDYASALPLFEKVVEKNPKNSNYRLRFANALEDDDQVERAIKQYEILIEQNPTHVLANVSLANAFRKVKEPDLAVSAMRKAIALKQREPWMLDNFGNILEEAGHLQEAYDNYKLAAQYEPYDTEFRTDLANVAVKMNKKDEAIKLFTQLKIEVSEQFQMLHQEEQATTDSAEKNNLQLEKEPYQKSYDYYTEMLSKLSK